MVKKKGRRRERGREEGGRYEREPKEGEEGVVDHGEVATRSPQAPVKGPTAIRIRGALSVRIRERGRGRRRTRASESETGGGEPTGSVLSRQAKGRRRKRERANKTKPEGPAGKAAP